MKKTIITILAITFIIGVTTASSQAGSSKRDRLKGFIIGSHVGFLGATIINQIHHDRQKAYAPEPRHNRKDKKHYRSSHNRKDKQHYRSSHRRQYRSIGHWEMKRKWVSEQYEERWNPGHYNKKGVWKSGRYQRIVVREGYWKEKRIWVARY